MDFVSRRELSRDASIESMADGGLSMSTSVARDLVHDLVGAVAIRRPGLRSAMIRATSNTYTHHAV